MSRRLLTTAMVLLLCHVGGRAGESFDAAVKRLATVGTFAFGGVGYAGKTSQGEIDFRIVLSQPGPVALAAFEKLYADGNPQAKSYALSGIRTLAPGRFKDLLAAAGASTVEVEGMRGCIVTHEPLGTVAEEIDRGEFSFRTEKSVAQLIDDLTQIDSQAPGIDSAAIYQGFIADDAPGSFLVGVLGVAPPKAPPKMLELVRLGPVALPELLKHLDDKRPTKLQVGNDDSPGSSHQVGVDAFSFSFFSDEYDPRSPHWFDQEVLTSGPRPMEKDFHGRYTVKVGDVCYVLIGQIVNRHLLAVRYQPSGGLVVNSPIEAPALAERVRSDWGNVDAEILRASLLADIHAANQPRRISRADYTRRFVNPALERLRLYFPETYASLDGDYLKKRRAFEKQANAQHSPN